MCKSSSWKYRYLDEVITHQHILLNSLTKPWLSFLFFLRLYFIFILQAEENNYKTNLPHKQNSRLDRDQYINVFARVCLLLVCQQDNTKPTRKTDFHKNWMEAGCQPKMHPINFWCKSW